MADYTIEKLKDADGNNFAFRDPTKATPSDITNAINALDVSDSAVTNQFVTKVSETDGKISVSRAQPTIDNINGLRNELNIRKHDTYTIAEFNALTKTYRECTVKLNNAQGAFNKAILLCDATSWWGKSTGSNGFSFRGNLIYTQTGSNNNDGYVDLSILVTSYGVKDLRSNNAKLRPVILKYTEGTSVSYYVALLITSAIDCIVSCNDTIMTGYWWATTDLLGTALKGDTNYSLPEGWEVFRDDNLRYGQSNTAQKLETARTIRTNLASTATASFDGSANVTPGVTGTLPIANGGTGATTRIEAEYNLLGGVEDLDSTLTDTRRFAIANQTKSSTNGVFRWYSLSTLWAWIAGKISSVLGLTATNYGGKAATAGTAAKATADASGNNIASTYATKSEIPDVSGKEDASNKVTTLDNSTTHYPSTSAVTTALSGKQDTISDIATIRSNATNGQTAYGWGNHANAGYLTDADLSGYAKADGSNASGEWGIDIVGNAATASKSNTGFNFSRLDEFAFVSTTNCIEIATTGSSGNFSVLFILNSYNTATTFQVYANDGQTYNNYGATIINSNGASSAASSTNSVPQFAVDAANRKFYVYWTGTATTYKRISCVISGGTTIPSVSNIQLPSNISSLTQITPVRMVSGNSVGSPTQPVYVDVQGAVQACTGSNFAVTSNQNITPTKAQLEANQYFLYRNNNATTYNLNIDADLLVDDKVYSITLVGDSSVTPNRTWNVKFKSSGGVANTYSDYASYSVSTGTLTTSYKNIEINTTWRNKQVVRKGSSVYIFGY